jgi:hypothetical protein
MSSRALTIRNLFDIKHSIFKMDEPWVKAFGEPEDNGLWLIWGQEKNGKTWFTLQLANYLSEIDKVLYISAEEGVSKPFVDTCKRAKIKIDNKNLRFFEYISLEELRDKIKRKRSYKVIIIDNCTIYNDELKYGELRKLITDYPDKLFILVAHEERGEPYTSSAKLAKKLAKVIIYVKGLVCSIYGRVPGGTLIIDEQRAKLFYGQNIIENGD